MRPSTLTILLYSAVFAVAVDVVAFLSIFSQLPVPVQSAFVSGGCTLLAAVIALTGVSLNLRWNRIKHRDDSAYQLRKETYLEASEAIAQIVHYLALLMQPDSRVDDSAKHLLSFSAAVSKVQTVAGREVRTAVNNLTREVVVTQLALAPLKHELNAGLREIDQLRKEVDFRVSELNNLINTRDGGGDVSQETINADLEGLTRMEEFFRSVSKEKRRQFTDYRDQSIKLVRHLRPFNAAVLAAFRSDLGLPSDHEWFEAEMKSIEEAIDRQMRVSKEEMEALQ